MTHIACLAVFESNEMRQRPVEDLARSDVEASESVVGRFKGRVVDP